MGVQQKTSGVEAACFRLWGACCCRQGNQSILQNRGIGKQISEGSKRYKLYKKLGVRLEGVRVESEREYEYISNFLVLSLL